MVCEGCVGLGVLIFYLYFLSPSRVVLCAGMVLYIPPSSPALSGPLGLRFNPAPA